MDEASTREQEGAGIGLAFAANLVELHDGTIDLENAEGEGTPVTVRLPRGPHHLADVQMAAAPPADDDPELQSISLHPSDLQPFNRQPTIPNGAVSPDSSPTPDDQSEPQNAKLKLVLVVDENTDVRRYVRSVLEPTFEVIEAADESDGTRKAREHLPDVILSDVMMPEVDGHAMTRRLKDDPETEAISVIMVTARAETQDEVEGLRVGTDDCVTKPFDTDVLEQRIRGVVAM